MAEADGEEWVAARTLAEATRRLGERLAAGEIGRAAFRRELFALLKGAPTRVIAKAAELNRAADAARREETGDAEA